MKIPIAKPFFGPEEFQLIQKPLETGWVVQGPYVKSFEDKFCSFTKASHSIATSSCTTSLQIAVSALGLKPGDEVIVPAFTWVATSNVVEFMGAKPVFCDIDLETYNIDVKQIENLITRKTVGLIPVHLFGLCADMDKIIKVASKHRLWIIEDAACAFGSYYNGKHSGTFGNMGCFSFHPRKSITTGEGGMITTQRKELSELSRSLRDHGASRSDSDRHHGKAGFLLSEYNNLGYNYRMTDFQGALGCAQIDKAAWILSEKSNRASIYDQIITEDIKWLRPPITPKGYVHGYQAYVCLFNPENPTLKNVDSLNEKRNKLMTVLEEKGISTRQGTHAPVILGYYTNKYGYKNGQFPNAYIADKLTFTLPLYVQMTESDLSYVCKSVQENFNDI